MVITAKLMAILKNEVDHAGGGVPKMCAKSYIKIPSSVPAYPRTDIQTDRQTYIHVSSIFPLSLFSPFLLGPFTSGKPQCGNNINYTNVNYNYINCIVIYYIIYISK